MFDTVDAAEAAAGGTPAITEAPPAIEGLLGRAKDYVVGTPNPLSPQAENQLTRAHMWWEIWNEPHKGRAVSVTWARRQETILQMMKEAGAPESWRSKFAGVGEVVARGKRAKQIMPSQLFNMTRRQAEGVAKGLSKELSEEFLMHWELARRHSHGLNPAKAKAYAAQVLKNLKSVLS